MQESQERMRERAHQLQGEVRQIFEAKSLADLVKLVDTVEHLGIDHRFRDEIAAAVSHVCREEPEFRSSNDLHVVALRFRLLRQHGIWVTTGTYAEIKVKNICKNLLDIRLHEVSGLVDRRWFDKRCIGFE